MAPYDYYNIESIEDYGEALEGIAYRGKITCAVCLKMFEQPSDCKRHEETVHGGKGPYGCKECVKKFSNKKDLEYHVHVQHTDPQRESCEQCDKSFSSKLSLDISATTAQNNNNEFSELIIMSQIMSYYHENKEHLMTKRK